MQESKKQSEITETSLFVHACARRFFLISMKSKQMTSPWREVIRSQVSVFAVRHDALEEVLEAVVLLDGLLDLDPHFFPVLL